jgi:hypothetical protein
MLNTVGNLKRELVHPRLWLITVSTLSFKRKHRIANKRAELNHVYCDPFDNFEYKVTLTRVNIVGKVHLEKYTCYVSHLSPTPFNSLHH